MPAIRSPPRSKFPPRSGTAGPPVTAMRRLATSFWRIPGQSWLDLLWLGPADFSAASLFTRRSGRAVIETFRFLSHDSAADESLQRAEFVLVLRRDKTDRITHRMGATGPTNPMNIILRVHRKVVVH